MPSGLLCKQRQSGNLAISDENKVLELSFVRVVLYFFFIHISSLYIFLMAQYSSFFKNNFQKLQLHAACKWAISPIAFFEFFTTLCLLSSLALCIINSGENNRKLTGPQLHTNSRGKIFKKEATNLFYLTMYISLALIFQFPFICLDTVQVSRKDHAYFYGPIQKTCDFHLGAG